MRRLRVALAVLSAGALLAAGAAALADVRPSPTARPRTPAEPSHTPTATSSSEAQRLAGLRRAALTLSHQLTALRAELGTTRASGREQRGTR